MKAWLVISSVLVGAMAITGCMSIEEQLASNDPAIRKCGEERLLEESRRSGKPEDRIAAIKRIGSSDLLRDIAKCAKPAYKAQGYLVASTIPEGQAALAKLTEEKDFAFLACVAESDEIRHAAIKKVNEQQLLIVICTKATDTKIRKSAMARLTSESLAQLPYSPAIFPYWSKIKDQQMLAKIYRDGCNRFSNGVLTNIAARITDSKLLEALVVPPSHEVVEEEKRRIEELECKMREAKDVFDTASRNADFCAKNFRLHEAAKERKKAMVAEAEVQRLQAKADNLMTYGSKIMFVTNDAARAVLYGRIKDMSVFTRMLSATDENNHPVFGTPDKILPVLAKMPEDKAVEFALDGLKNYNVYRWNRDEFLPLEIAAGIAGITKSQKTRADMAFKVLDKIESFRQWCAEQPMYSWGMRDDQDEGNAKRIIAMFAPLSDDEKIAIVGMGGYAWRRLLGDLSADVAGRVLLSGHVLSAELEEKLSEKVLGDGINLKMYNAVKSDKAKKILAAKMPDDVKKEMQMEAENAFVSLMTKAKEAAKSTFELDGFYLGMTFNDVKVAFSHHFPDLQFRDDIDGEGKDADHVIYVDGQRDPFCYASVNSKKVYRFNFGRKLLKKWYNYDASTARDWAKAYSKEHGIDLKLDFINRSGEVYLPNAMLQAEPYHVSLHQEIWTYKNGMKNYRLTYFGEREFGGNSSIVKAAAHDKYSFVSASEGTFRAAIEND